MSKSDVLGYEAQTLLKPLLIQSQSFPGVVEPFCRLACSPLPITSGLLRVLIIRRVTVRYI